MEAAGRAHRRALDSRTQLRGLGFAFAVVNAAIRLLFAMGREQASARPRNCRRTVPLSLVGILHPHAYTLADLLPFAALGWLCLGAIAAGVLLARRPTSFETLGRVFMPAPGSQGGRRALRASRSASRPRGGM